MNCIIIEDERHAIKHLENQIALSGFQLNVLERIGTVTKAVEWLRKHEVDLIFLDVQLVDGLSFEIFDHVQVRTPIIFTTSYDQYITKAFELNSISYLLKPVKQESLGQALSKFRFLYSKDEIMNDKIYPVYQTYQKRFLIQSGAFMITVDVEEAAWFSIENGRFVVLTTKDNQQHLLDEGKLELLEQRLDPAKFFRINRQFIVNVGVISRLEKLNKGKIKIETTPPSKDEMIVSTEKASEFKSWLNG